MGCLKFVLYAALAGFVAIILNTAFSPGGIWSSRPRDYAEDALTYCGAGIGRARAIAPRIEPLGVIDHDGEGADMIFTCAARLNGAPHVVHVRAGCGRPLECAEPLAIFDAAGAPVWVGEGVNAATLPGTRGRQAQ